MKKLSTILLAVLVIISLGIIESKANLKSAQNKTNQNIKEALSLIGKPIDEKRFERIYMFGEDTGGYHKKDDGEFNVSCNQENKINSISFILLFDDYVDSIRYLVFIYDFLEKNKWNPFKIELSEKGSVHNIYSKDNSFISITSSYMSVTKLKKEGKGMEKEIKVSIRIQIVNDIKLLN